MSSAEQLLILPKLKAEPDSAESPAQLFSQLLQKLADGPERAEVLSLMKSLYREKGGPFSDVALRPRSGAALARVWGESESAEICKEKHAFTQLEMVKRAFKVEWWAYSSIITRKGQLLSLEKLRVNPGQPAEELLSYLLQTSGAEKVRSEVLRRYEERHAPFTPQL